MIPGEILTKSGEIELNKGRRTTEMSITNEGDRPVQIGSHYHFFEVNKLLAFDRKAAFGMRLDIPSGTSVRFEPGETRSVPLVEMGGRKRIFGLNSLTEDQANPVTLQTALDRARKKGFVNQEGK